MFNLRYPTLSQALQGTRQHRVHPRGWRGAGHNMGEKWWTNGEPTEKNGQTWFDDLWDLGLGTWPGGATASTLAETDMDEGWVMLGASWYIRKSTDVV